MYLVCFSVVSHTSFENVATWIEEIKEIIPEAVIVLVGLKTDLREDAETLADLSAKGLSPISKSAGEAKCEELGGYVYLECSTKNNFAKPESFQDHNAIPSALISIMREHRPKKEKKKKRCLIM